MDLSEDLYVIVPNWERFQHYRDRHPVWIKLYSQLLHDPKFLALSLASRGLLMTIWLMYGQALGELRVRDVTTLERHRGGFGLQLISLRDAGFIELSASRLLAAKKEEEKEKEKEKPSSRESKSVENDPPPDPDALKKIRELAAKVTGKLEEPDW